MKKVDTINTIMDEFQKRLEGLDGRQLKKIASGEYEFTLVKKVSGETGGMLSSGAKQPIGTATWSPTTYK